MVAPVVMFDEDGLMEGALGIAQDTVCVVVQIISVLEVSLMPMVNTPPAYKVPALKVIDHAVPEIVTVSIETPSSYRVTNVPATAVVIVPATVVADSVIGPVIVPHRATEVAPTTVTVEEAALVLHDVATFA